MKLAEIFSDYFTVRKELLLAVDKLTQPQLDWTPPLHPASIGRLLAHIADCEYFWIGHVATKAVEVPDYTPFKQATTLAEILPLLHAEEERFTRYLGETDLEDWDNVFYSFTHKDGSIEKFSMRWLVWHVVEHQARHRGQIFMLMRMQGIVVPDV